MGTGWLVLQQSGIRILCCTMYNQITVPISSAQISLHLNKDISLTKRGIGSSFFGDTREASVIVIVIVVPLSLPSLWWGQSSNTRGAIEYWKLFPLQKNSRHCHTYIILSVILITFSTLLSLSSSTPHFQNSHHSVEMLKFHNLLKDRTFICYQHQVWDNRPIHPRQLGLCVSNWSKASILIRSDHIRADQDMPGIMIKDRDLG